MTAHPLVTLAAALGLVLLVVLVRRGRARLAFGATMARHHPELAHQVVEHRQLGRVAARAIDVRTTPASRELAAHLEVV